MIDSLRVNIQLLREEIWEERLIGEEEDRNIERGEDTYGEEEYSERG